MSGDDGIWTPGFYDEDGNRLRVTVQGGHGFSVQAGVVHRWCEDADGHREEWTEPLCESPIRDVFTPWIWDAVNDPRNDPPH